MKKIILLIWILTLGLTIKVTNADYVFGTPTNLGPTVNSTSADQSPSISADGLSLYFSDHAGVPFRSGGYGNADIWITTRATKDDPWGEPVNLGPTVNSSSMDESPSISTDGLSLYFSSNRSSGSGNYDLWVTTRETKDDPWRTPINLGPKVNTNYGEFCPCISADGLSLYFCDYIPPRPGGYGVLDIYVTTRSSISDPWDTPTNLGPIVNSSGIDATPNISRDGLLLFFSSDRSGALGDDLYVTKRSTTVDPWGTPVNLGNIINESGFDAWPNISADGSTLNFSSVRPDGSGGPDLWQVNIRPVVDLNGDYIVDSADICILVDNWGTDNHLCDIGPMPWGDGIVDVQDLIVFAEHLFEDYRLVAHWKLDEEDGNMAYNSVANKDATLHGNPVWQPAGGKVGGALEFDGNNDYISTPFIINPGNGSVSAFAWIKGGGPGQVIISQTGDFGGTWLGVDPSGMLMTGFSGMYFGDLVSESVVTDGQWHHVGFVYDMDSLHRLLYVDGILVAEDATVISGMPSDGGLYIGASKDLEAGSFFSGLIDDIRIYNQALTAEEIAALVQ